MKQEVKEEWITELKSGRYTQGRGMLTIRDSVNGNKHCCMGVLCEIAVAHGIIPAGRWHDQRQCVVYGEEKQAAILPAEVADWASIQVSGELGTNLPVKRIAEFYRPEIENHDSLTSANDGGYTFEEIAEVIQAQF